MGGLLFGAIAFDLDSWSDLERSKSRSLTFHRAVTSKRWQIWPNLLMWDRKSYMPLHLAPLPLTSSDLERSNQGHAYFRGL